MCYYGNAMHNCNHSPFPNDDRCVCGTAQSDWKTPEQCRAPTPPQPNPSTQCTKTAAGQKSVYLPGCFGTGCGLPYNTPNCAFCVYDMYACTAAYGAAACQATYDARKAQGVDGCPSSATSGANIDAKEEEEVLVATPEVAKADLGCMCYYGNAMHNCNHSPFPNDNRCVCGTAQSDWKTPEQCRAPAPPQPNPSTQCTKTAAGQKSVYLPGCFGTGCGLPYNTPNCAFCVYDMYACTAAYGAAACQATYDARKAQGVDGCPSSATSGANIDAKEEEEVLVTTPEVAKADLGCMCYYGNEMHNCNHSPFPNDNRCVCGTAQSDWKTPEQCRAPTPPQPNPSTQCTKTAAGQKSVYLPGCFGTGCGLPYNTPNCAFCVYDMYACTAAYGAAACQATYDARKAQGVDGCPSSATSGANIIV
jgi:hypothetical protein